MNKKRLLQTIGLTLKRGAGQRGEYLREKHILASVGENVYFQPRLVPLYPELIKLHNMSWYRLEFDSSHMMHLL